MCRGSPVLSLHNHPIPSSWVENLCTYVVKFTLRRFARIQNVFLTNWIIASHSAVDGEYSNFGEKAPDHYLRTPFVPPSGPRKYVTQIHNNDNEGTANVS